MDPEKPPRAFRQFLEEHSIQLLNKHDHFHCKEELKMEDWMLYKPSVIGSIFQLLLNSSNHNILLVDKTETIVGLLRKIQKWSFSSIISEFRLYYGNKSSYFMESFLELLPIELVSFEDIPTPDYTKCDVDKSSAEMSSASNETLYDRGRRQSLDQILNDDSGRLSQDFETNLSLSASPKIPENLLKLAEFRKQKRKAHKTDKSHHYTPQFQYVYYKPTNITINPLKQKSSISVKLPPEKLLPLWFINGRDAWEKEHQESMLKHYSS